MLLFDSLKFCFFLLLLVVTKLFLVLGKSRFLAESKIASFKPANVRHLACMEVFMLNLVYFLSKSFKAVLTPELLKI